MKKRVLAISALVLVGITVGTIVLIGAAIKRTSRVAESRKHNLVYAVDHDAILRAAREVQMRASSYRQDPDWHNVPPGTFRYPDPDDPTLPQEITRLGPSTIVIDDEYVKIELGGAPGHYGLLAYPDGVKGRGLKELVPGLWYYSDDGRIPQSVDPQRQH